VLYLAREQHKLNHLGRPREGFSAAFFRAVRGLVQRGLLTALRLVLLDALDPSFTREDDVERLADGVYLHWESRQIRFVKREENFTTW
jgi:hypothetical protein